MYGAHAERQKLPPGRVEEYVRQTYRRVNCPECLVLLPSPTEGTFSQHFREVHPDALTGVENAVQFLKGQKVGCTAEPSVVRCSASLLPSCHSDH